MEALSGLGGLIILILDIWAISHVWRSNNGLLGKVIWTLVIFFLPVVGLIIWALAGPRKA